MKAPLLTLGIICILFPVQLLAQGTLYIANNATFKVVGNATIKLNNASLENDGNFVAGSGTVEFQGTNDIVQIKGGQTTTFNHLTVNRLGQKVELGKDVQVNGNVTFTEGTLDLKGKNLTLGQPNGKLVNESETSHIIAATGGEVITTLTLNAPNQNNPGNIGVVLTSAANLGSTTIRRGHVPKVLPVFGNSVQRYFDIQPANNNNLNATLRFFYFQSELNGLSEANLNLFRNNGSGWKTGNQIGAGGQTSDTNLNWVEKTGLPQITTTWALAACAPVFGTTAQSICPGTTFNFNGQNLASAGVYKDTLTAVTGCDSIVTLTLSVYPAVTTQLSNSPYAVCKDSSLLLNPGVFSKYLWSTGATTPTLQVSSSSTLYIVTVTDANNCTAIDTASVMELQLLSVVIAQPGILTCSATQIVLDGSGSASGPSIMYTWTTTGGNIVSGGMTNKATVNKLGTYTLMVSGPAQSCPNTATVTVIEQKDAPISAVLTLKNVTCKGKNDGQLTIGQVNGGIGPYTYSLNGGTFQPTTTFNNLASGTYMLTVQGSNGCTTTQSFSIQEGALLSPALGSDLTICPGASVTLDAGSFFGYLWSDNQTSSTITVSTPGMYTVTVSDAQGCTGTDVLEIKYHPPVTAQATSSDILTCNKSQVTLSSTGSTSGAVIQYLWTTANGLIQSGANGSSPIVTEGGVYHLLVTNAVSTCTATDTVSVSELGEQISAVKIEPVNIQCAGKEDGEITITSVGNGALPFSYSLNNGPFQADNVFTNLKPGQYSLIVRGTDGCEANVNASLTAPPPMKVTVPAPNDLLKEGSSFTLNPSVTGAQGSIKYAWQGSKLSCEDCAMPDVSPIFQSVYSLTVTDANGCTATATVSVNVDSKKGPDIITPGNEDGKNDELEFTELEEEPAKSLNDIIILNRWGQIVFEDQPYKNNWNGVTQDGKELPEGTYYYVLTLRGGNKSVIHGSVLVIR